MSETESGAGAGAQDAESKFDIQKVYTKDISFETPNSPDIFRSEWQPDVNVQLHTAANQLAEGFYEVGLTVTVTAKIGERTAYLVEVQQCGIFQIAAVADEDMPPLLGSLCPGILFPYAREAVSDLVTRGGFPQLVLSPVNFDALYYAHVMQNQEPAAQV